MILRYPLLSLCAIILGCTVSYRSAEATDPPRSGAARETAMTYSVLVERLRSAIAAVKPAGRIDQPFFSAAGRATRVNGEDVQVFVYPTPAAAEAEARRVSPNGTTIGASKPLWIGTPHFFRQGRLIVLYLGDDKKIIQALETALGRQFAGQ